MVLYAYNKDYWNLEHEELTLQGKSVYLFLNHKVASYCWAQIRKEYGTLDVITFDSHYDCLRVVLDVQRNLGFSDDKQGELNIGNHNVFSSWKSDKKDKEEYRKFFSQNNDNFIYISMMKNDIKNISSYYHNDINHSDNSFVSKDINGGEHYFKRTSIRKFVKPKSQFILDVDLDFFVKQDENFNYYLIADSLIDKYLNLLKELFDNESCKGLSIALEPIFFSKKTELRNLLYLMEKKFSTNLLKHVRF